MSPCGYYSKWRNRDRPEYRRNLRFRRFFSSIHPNAAAGSGFNGPGVFITSVTGVWLCFLCIFSMFVTAVVSVSPSSLYESLQVEPTQSEDITRSAHLGDGDEIREAIHKSQDAETKPTFYVCPPPTGSTIVRLEPTRTCPDYHLGKNFTEGIAVVYKENIAAYKFKATVYYKDVIVSTAWAGSSYTQITNRYADRVPIPVSEITDTIDKFGKCSSKATYVRNNHKVEAFNEDKNPQDMPLIASKYNSVGSKAWHTTNDTYMVAGTPGTYRTGTSVNCIIEEVEARSIFPYDSFGLSTGDIIYMSPFFGLRDGAYREHSNYAMDRFHQFEGYRQRDLDTRALLEPAARNFLVTPHLTVGWNWKPKRTEVCSLVKWREVEDVVRDEYAHNFRFTMKTLSTTFISETNEFNLNQIHLSQCVKEEARAIINRIYTTRYNSSHVRTGDIQTYLARGGFVVVFQPLLSNSLARLYLQELVRENTNHSPQKHPTRNTRSRRSVPVELRANRTITTTSSVEFAMLQFTYDHIQEHVNEMLARISSSWCQLQNRERALWSGLFPINPSALASTILDQRVKARILGDVISVSNCPELGSDTRIILQNSMRVSGSTTRCYSRPLISIVSLNGSGTVEGQLGTDNELIMSRDLLEPCVANHKRYFLFGHHYVYYEDYRYVREIAVHDVGMISTYVDLNLTLLKDREFMPLQVYTRDELRDTGLLDYSEIQRRNQMHSLRFYDIDKVVQYDSGTAIMQGMAQFFQGLGTAGQAVGHVVLGATGALLSTVHGFTTFLSNPFGALAVGLLVLAGLVAAFFAYRYVLKLKTSPMKALYPLTTKGLKQLPEGMDPFAEKPNATDTPIEEIGDSQNTEPSVNSGFDPDKFREAQEMIKYMTLVSAAERQESKARKKNKTSALLTSRLTGLALRNRRGYSRVRTENVTGV
uniref:ORF31 n=5 Tax=Human herpesvirus 3 TaxID=10335 RepID=A0A3G2KSA3_HHV3|nr:ORF31 [Human alphaherpesvirus 3]WJZ62280.1 MAG: envelope glycoprotein B [Human alphaherpesvirus 3]WKR23366.1 envelope glycoprotein B [Human alphaherpesvirus 3]WKR23732.1 envelope glycoprotein B [Human alphaherpesvirus 3]WKR24168.1 envelope glycoprotein B [Human alphaherpesvirus 3]